MAPTTFTTRDGYSYQYRAADPVLGIRIGRNAAERLASQNHSPRGAVARLAADLARYGAEHTRDAEGNFRPAFTSNEVRDPSRVKPRVAIENVLAAERWYATHAKRPNEADLRAMIAGTVGDADAADVAREAIADALRGSSSDGERERSAQLRKARNERDAARRLAAKGRR